MWLEVKHAWRAWFYDGVNHNKPFMYNGYFGGEHHTHSVAHDFKKLDNVPRADAAYVALLIVGFDASDGGMRDDMQRLATHERLSQRGWQYRSAEWSTKESEEC